MRNASFRSGRGGGLSQQEGVSLDVTSQVDAADEREKRCLRELIEAVAEFLERTREAGGRLDSARAAAKARAVVDDLRARLGNL